MEKQPITISINERPRFGMGTVIAIYGNAARNLHGLGRCIAAAAIGGSFGPFSADRKGGTRFFMFDTLSNEFETRGATEAILDMAENTGYCPDEATKIGWKSAISWLFPNELKRLGSSKINEADPNILIISGAEDIPDSVKSQGVVRAAFRWFKQIAEFHKVIVILEFGLDPKNMGLIKTALIDNCNYAFLTEEDKNTGRITVTPTKWDERIPTMYIDTDPEGVPTITLEGEEE